MIERSNSLGQAIGAALPRWKPARRPPRTAMTGRWCQVEPIDPARHGDALFAAFSEDREGRLWTYLNIGPFPTRASFDAWMQAKIQRDDPLYHAIVDRSTGEAGGFASLMRLDRGSGVIEMGNIVFAPRLQRGKLATEAMHLMMRRVFEELGNRRCEWRCDSLNAASRRAAERLGFTLEGVFRQARVYKGRTRDTAWYAMLDHEWATLRPAYEAWLSDANFDADGRQRESLGTLIAQLRASRDATPAA